jgi:holo-[acyl-carrier protein] synthase
MIYGIGTDIVAVARLRGMWESARRKALDKLLAPRRPILPRRLTRALSGQALCRQGSLRQGPGHRRSSAGDLLPAIGVGHDELGKPVIDLATVNSLKWSKKNLKAHLSISDEADYAVAYVILEQA